VLGTGHAGLPAERLVEAYRRMALIRVFEERVSDLYRDGEVPGFVHLSIGQEASAAGACLPRGIRDSAGPVFVERVTYRWHGHCEGDPERYRSRYEVTAVLTSLCARV
jgi:2-oxoisovalerate dehydrogenase E1 component